MSYFQLKTRIFFYFELIRFAGNTYHFRERKVAVKTAGSKNFDFTFKTFLYFVKCDAKDMLKHLVEMLALKDESFYIN